MPSNHEAERSAGPVANGTATGYSTGDAMFKAAAETDLPRRVLGSEPHGADLAPADVHRPDRVSTPRAQWRVADEDEASDPHEAVPRDDRERPSANEPSELSD